jgi:hypothetical protein
MTNKSFLDETSFTKEGSSLSSIDSLPHHPNKIRHDKT